MKSLRETQTKIIRSGDKREWEPVGHVIGVVSNQTLGVTSFQGFEKLLLIEIMTVA